MKVHGVEVSLRPDHNGEIVFRRVFKATSDEQVRQASRFVVDNCLSDPATRAVWIGRIRRAMEYLADSSEFANQPRGKLAELHFLVAALRNYGA